MKARLDAIMAGEIYIDLIMSGFSFWPRPGQEAVASFFHRAIGGGAAITGCGMARLGARVGVFSAAGEDTGAWVVAQLARCGVDASALIFDPVEPTAFTVAATTPEDRAFLTYPGANRCSPAALAAAAAQRRFSRARHVHIASGPDLDRFPELLRSIRRNGCTISLDVGWHEEWLRDPRSLAGLRAVDMFFPNEVEARTMTGESDPVLALKRFAEAGLTRVILKRGACGAAMLWDGEVTFAKPLVVTPVDTTGAGDCFDAGFLHAWLMGAPPSLCLQTANICGALSTEAYGGIAGFPAPERVQYELKRQP
jgi:sugar/nucleoside kinase (ribokinase family)